MSMCMYLYKIDVLLSFLARNIGSLGASLDKEDSGNAPMMVVFVIIISRVTVTITGYSF
jgi:hypothetical protein